MATSKSIWLLACSIVLIAACGGGGSNQEPDDPVLPLRPPTAPTGVTASPANAQATLSWTAVSGATSYNVYSSPTSPVTTGSNKTNVTTSSATLSALANGAPVYVAVAAVNAGGESPLSTEVCAVPTTASTTGLTLYDPLCASTLDGAKWRTPLFSRAVVNGAMVLSTQTSNMESLATRGLVYSTRTIVNAGTQRASTLKATVTVPAAIASRTRSAEIFAGLTLLYQPPANRLVTDIGGFSELLRIQIGFVDNGSGLRAARRISHCDNANCTSSSSTGIAFTDPAGFGSSGEAAAAYDTPYTVTVRLDEATGNFTWSIAGGGFGAGVTGTANPAAYLANNSTWSALGANPLAEGGGFLNAQLRTRVSDDSSTGGSSGSITAQFDDVHVGFNNAPAVLWDDFSGANGNSGPTLLSAAKWTPGKQSLAINSGSLAEHLQISSSSSDFLSHFQGLLFSDPAAVNTMQADVTVSSCANSASNSSTSVSLEANVYNDGTPGTAPPNNNAEKSMVGEIRAYLILDCAAQAARFQILRWNTTTPLTGTVLSKYENSTVPMGAAPIVGNTHTLRMKWDPVTRVLTFQVDGETPVVVDPTTVNAHMREAAPYVRAPNLPLKQIGGYVAVPFVSAPSSVPRTASIDFRVNNVFTAP